MSNIDLIRLKVKRAYKHIRDVEGELLAFKNTNPYTVGTKRNPQTRQLIYHITKADDVPRQISVVAGDALQNLRTALDHIAWQLCPASLRTKQTAFPVFDSAAKYESEKTRAIKGMPQAAVDAIDAAKPYKGGNDPLWRLHRLNNIDKHRLLIAVGASFQSFNIRPILMEGVVKLLGHVPETLIPDFNIRPSVDYPPLKVGSVLFTDMPDAKVRDKMDFRIEVAFGEPGVCEGESLLETLKGMADIVDHLVSNFAPLV